jgi:hypothetical protein
VKVFLSNPSPAYVVETFHLPITLKKTWEESAIEMIPLSDGPKLFLFSHDFNGVRLLYNHAARVSKALQIQLMDSKGLDFKNVHDLIPKL